VTREALWPWALDVYGRPGVEALLLELQDSHAQCVPYLLWALWMAMSGRAADDAALAAGAALARAWQDAAIAPLRRMRRDLKAASKSGPAAAREQLRHGIKRLELDAERMLLQMLEEASPATADTAEPPLQALDRAARVWSARVPASLLARLAALIA
jgi:uncharacterized protein (TIGR02444 family)